VSMKDAEGGVNSLRGVAIRGSLLGADACITSIERAVVTEGPVKSRSAMVVPEDKARSTCSMALAAMEGVAALDLVEASGVVAVEGVAAGAMVCGKRKK
jgi:hypothetical protein